MEFTSEDQHINNDRTSNCAGFRKGEEGRHTRKNSFGFFLSFFLMWTIFNVFIEFVTVLLLLHLLAPWP